MPQGEMVPKGTSENPPSLFNKLGDSYHFRIENQHDLAKVLDLDEALWIATTAPSSTLKTDAAFLEHLDSDQDKRIRAEEIKDGIRYLFEQLSDHSSIRENNTSLPLSAVNENSEIGRRIRGSAEKILKRLEQAPTTITLDQVRTIKQEVLEGGLDQAGVVLPEATDEERIRVFIEDVVATVGGADHPSGSQGVDLKSLQNFMTQCGAYLDWRLEAGAIGTEDVTEILVLGPATGRRYALFQKLRNKLYQYFLLCDIKRLNPDLLERAVNNPEVNAAYNLMNIDDAESYLGSAPLSMLEHDGSLDLKGEINPYFIEDLREFAEHIVKPLLGAETTRLDKEGFTTLQQLFKPYKKWMDRKPATAVENLGDHTLQRYAEDASLKTTIEELIDKSHQTAIILENLYEVERLILYQAHMLPLVNSFVSFPYLYDPERRALFEEGTLVMDGRHFTMAVKVEDRQRHIATCKGSNIFVLYCELFGKDGSKLHEIAVPVTAGNRGTLQLNKWGIFNDLSGNELHAKVVDIVENPISVSEAVIDPFMRLKTTFFSRLEEFSSKAEEQLFKEKDKDKKKETSSGTLLGIGGVAVAALGSSLAFITQTISAMSLKTVFVAILVIAALIVVPTAVSAYARLSRRDLSAILEGAGWGLNSRMKLTTPQANNFTRRPSRRNDF
jgi:hypothetical protein